MGFFIEWIFMYMMIMVAMCVDNICWIPDSREFGSIKKNFYVFVLLKREWVFPRNKEGWKYVYHNRILEVLKHPRDILPAIITSFIITIMKGGLK